jgi:ribonuclease J
MNSENTNSNKKPEQKTGAQPQRRSYAPRPSSQNNNQNRFQKRPAGNSNRRSFGNNKPNHVQRAGISTTVRRPVRKSRPNRVHTRQQKQLPVPPIGENVRIIPVGGVEQVGQNMTAIEVGNDIIVIDCGFQFPEESTPGIDYILPNTTYLEENKHRIKGLFITHGHLDHIGGIPFIIDKLGYPKVYSRQFGAIMIAKRQEEFPHLKKLDIVTLDGDETVSISDNFKIETFSISHAIPDSMGLILHTHLGDIAFIEDVRVDNIQGVPTEEEVSQYKRFHKPENNVLLLTMDSTNAGKQGWSLSEIEIMDNIETIIRDAPGRLIIGTFASQVDRILGIIELADKHGKKIIVEGRSMKSNLEIIKHLNLLKSDNIATLADLDHLAPDKVVMLVTGAQGEEFAALMRMANKSHKQIQLRKEDTVLLSSSVIPSNWRSVADLKNYLYTSGAKIITYADSDVHASGHGNREELKWIHNQFDYQYFMPVHGEAYMLELHKQIALEAGAKEENILLPQNGSIIQISGTKEEPVVEKLPMRIPFAQVTVDGFSVSDQRDVVLRDRIHLSKNGIFVVVASINTRTGKLKKSPDIISRGFVYLRESQELLQEARNIIRKVIEREIGKTKSVDFDKLKDIVESEVSKFIFQKTAKEPLVIPVILGI